MSNRHRASRWLTLVLIVLVPVAGTGCPIAGPVAGKILLKVGIWLGGMLISSVVGKTVESALDGWFFGKDAKNTKEVGKVKADATNPLRGVYKGEIRFTRDDEGGGKRTFLVQDPPMVRDSPTSAWKLSPEVRESVNLAIGN